MSSNSRYRLRYESSKHTNLSTQQRRLRHLTGIVGRNIDPLLIPTTRHTPKCSLLSLYFTIHQENNIESVLYKSEIIEDTLNPNWREFDTQAFLQNPSCNRDSSIIVCLWGARKSNDYRVILKYDVHFSGLVYYKEQLRSSDQSYETNCLLFCLFGGYYKTKSTQNNHDDNNVIVEENVLCRYLKVDQNQLCLSYKKQSLLRAHFTLKAIHQTRQQVSEVKKKMQERLHQNENRLHKLSSKEALRFRNELLRNELQRLKNMLATEEKVTSSKSLTVQNNERDLRRRQDELEQYICQMKICHSVHIERRETLLKVSAHLNFRRRQLAAELSYIYPIIELPLKDGNKREYAITGARLPNSEEFVGEDETMLAVAIGSAGHLVLMLAKFLELPLRYPIRPMGSRSSVVDLVTDKLTDKQREFPLYSKGKEKFQFHYGVFLLNKNIAQLRYHNGLGTADLRNTLPNLRHLLETKYGVKVVAKPNQPVSAFNKAVISRTISLPRTSSHVERISLPPDDVDGDNLMSFEPSSRPRSEVLTSGLPSVHVKAHHQHRFISRKGTNRKLQKGQSLSESPNSSDLIAVPFEDLVKRTFNGTLSSSTPSNADDSMITAVNGVDPAEDCLKHEESYVNVHQMAGQNNETIQEQSRPYSRQFSDSDALIIPDPFEGEPEDLSSPMTPVGENLLV